MLSTKQENTQTKKSVLTTHFTKEFTVQFAVVFLPYKQDSLKLHWRQTAGSLLHLVPA